MTVSPDILKSLDYAIGYAEAAGGEPLPPDASEAYRAGWRFYFIRKCGTAPKPAEAVL